MNKIKFNNTEFEVGSYSKTTNFSDGTIHSTAYCSLITNNIAELQALGLETITSIEISHDNEVIYELNNLTAKINDISEYLNGNTIDVSLNLVF